MRSWAGSPLLATRSRSSRAGISPAWDAWSTRAVSVATAGEVWSSIAQWATSSPIAAVTSPDKEADARRLGAHKFALTKDAAQLKKLGGYFDFIIDTVSAKHDYNLYLQLLATDGVMICVGAPPTPAEVAMFGLMFGRRSLAGSGIGGLPETQEMLDYCAAHGISSDIEMINIADINKAYERMLKSDVRYRFVIDMASLA